MTGIAVAAAATDQPRRELFRIAVSSSACDRYIVVENTGRGAACAPISNRVAGETIFGPVLAPASTVAATLDDTVVEPAGERRTNPRVVLRPRSRSDPANIA